MIGFVIRFLGNILALYAASYFIVGFAVNGGIKEYALAGVLLGILNFSIKPALKVLTMPLIILTLGLWTIVINALMLWTVDYMFPFIHIQDLTTLVWATIMVSVVNLLVSTSSKLVS